MLYNQGYYTNGFLGSYAHINEEMIDSDNKEANTYEKFLCKIFNTLLSLEDTNNNNNTIANNDRDHVDDLMILFWILFWCQC